MIMTHEGHHDLSSWIVHVLHKNLRECLCKSCPVDFSWDTDFARFLCVVRHSWVKFPHSPILHYAFSSWIEKTMTKQYIAIRKTDLFYNSMGLCGNFLPIHVPILKQQSNWSDLFTFLIYMAIVFVFCWVP